MKKALLTIAIVAVATVAQAQMISGWTFETSVPTTAGPHTAELGANPGSALGSHAGGATVYSNPTGNGSAESFSSNTWATGDYYQFSLSTASFSDIFVTFSSLRSGTGPATFSLQYSSTGAGGTFTEFTPYTILDTPSWSSATYRPEHQFSFDLSGIAALDNNANVVFRLVDTAATGAGAGTARVDDFYVSAGAPIVVPEPATWMLMGIGLLVGAQRLRRKS